MFVVHRRITSPLKLRMMWMFFGSTNQLILLEAAAGRSSFTCGNKRKASKVNDKLIMASRELLTKTTKHNNNNN